MLQDGNKKIVQSLSIGRYLGRKFNLYGSNKDDKWKIDVILDGTNDIRVKYYDAIFHGTDEDKLKLKNEIIPLWLGYFEKIKEKSVGEWFVGEKPSIADCYMFDILDVLNTYDEGCVKNYEKLNEFMEFFSNMPNIKNYLDSDRRNKN